MTVPFDNKTHLLQLDAAAVPEGFVELGPRDIATVHIARFGAGGQNIANYAIPARFVTIETEDGFLTRPEPIDLRKTQLSFNDPPPADGYKIGENSVAAFGEAMIAAVNRDKAAHDAEMTAIRDEAARDQS